MEQITPENALSVQHADWLKHPTTITMIKLLEKQKQQLVAVIINDAYVGTESEIRYTAVGLKQTDVIKGWITNTDKFVQLANKE